MLLLWTTSFRWDLSRANRAARSKSVRRLIQSFVWLGRLCVRIDCRESRCRRDSVWGQVRVRRKRETLHRKSHHRCPCRRCSHPRVWRRSSSSSSSGRWAHHRHTVHRHGRVRASGSYWFLHRIHRGKRAYRRATRLVLLSSARVRRLRRLGAAHWRVTIFFIAPAQAPCRVVNGHQRTTHIQNFA